jgi:hypothetical protein
MFRPQGDGGKGDSPRPIPDREKFDSNWDNIFGKKKNEQPTTTPPTANDDEPDVAGGVRPSDTAS